uniref:Uncharacterized protein n=1 Tax=uncultured bacterium Contig16 TaxID=1393468 RepID=W0FH42_9BACT|nr:hypothetical protein [uncultured bacterium Contig16]
MMKKIAAMLLAACMIMAVLAGCTGPKAPETEAPADTKAETQAETETETETETEIPTEPAADMDPLTMLTNGVYGYTYNVGFDNTNFFHFYEEQPVFGKIWYAGFVVNQIVFYGKYDVKEEAFDWACWDGRAAEENEEEKKSGTAPYTIYFYDMDGNELDKCGFDGENLYHTMENITFQGSGSQIYKYVGFDSQDYADFYAGEIGQKLVDLVGDDDRTSTLQIFHTGRYDDLVAYEIEGSWAASEEGDAIVYTLTPDDETESAVKLTVNKDGSAVYAPEGGDEVAMHSLTGPAVVWNFKGDGPEVSEGVKCALTLSMMDDNTVKLDADAFGNILTIDQGTWEQVNDYTFKIKMDLAGEVESELVESTPTFNIKETGSQLGDFEASLPIDLSGMTGGEVTEVWSFAGEGPEVSEGTKANIVLTIYSDNSAKVTADAFGQMIDLDQGTWEQVNDYTFKVNLETAGEVESELIDSTPSFNISIPGTMIGDVETVLAIVLPEEDTTEAAE